MRKASSYLYFLGNQYKVQIAIPKDLQGHFGKKKLVASLGTDSLAVANRLKHQIIADFQKQILEAKKLPRPDDPLIKEALSYRSELKEAKINPAKYREYDRHGELVAEGHESVLSFIEDRTLEIAETDPGRASLFHKVASGSHTLLELHIEAWLAEAQMKPRQVQDYKRAVAKLIEHLMKEGLPPTIEAVTKQVAGQYVSHMSGAGRNPTTINKDISACSSYWRYLEKKGIVESSPWLKQSLKKVRKSKAEKKRPFTDDELKTLLAGKAPLFLADAIRIAALSGMRVEEIARLRVADIVKNCFDIKKAKTASGERLVPIHPDLSLIVERRTKGKKADQFLFDELPDPKAGSASERGQKITKAFGRYRKALKVDEVIEGERQSLIDFHSFRRWFVSKCQAALERGVTGFTPYTVAEVVGHKKEDISLGMTFGVYAGASAMTALRACVESVRLPLPS